VVEWNWKNVSEKVKNDVSLRRYINEMFVSPAILPVMESEVSAVSAGKPKSHDLSSLVSDFSFMKSPSPKSIPRPVQAAFLPPKKSTSIEGYDEVDVLASRLVNHAKTYGQYPDFHNLKTLKKKSKAVSYIKCTLARPDISDEMALLIADKAAVRLSI